MSNNKHSFLIVSLGVLISISLIAYSVYATSIGSTITTAGLTVTGSSLLSTTTIAGNLAVNTNQLYIDKATSNIGIGTSSPSYTLDVAGNIRATKSLTSGINVETLTGDKTLTPGTDEMYQYLDPNGASRTITLATSTAKAGDRWMIKNNGSYSSSYYLQIQQGGTDLDYIYAQGVKHFIFDGTNWQGSENGTKDGNNMAIGYNTNGRYFGVAIGGSASADGGGTAVGYTAKGQSNGVAVGNNASGQSNGVAVGKFTYGYSSGVAVGFTAKGANNGLSIGYYAGHNLDFTTLTTNENTLIGYKAGDTLTTGNHNLLIGYDIDVPTATTSNYLSIGNLIFGTGMNTTGTAVSSNGKVGIGTSTPETNLQVVDPNASSTIRVGDTSKTGCIELGNGTNLYYIYIDTSGTLITTTTKPAICQ